MNEQPTNPYVTPPADPIPPQPAMQPEQPAAPKPPKSHHEGLRSIVSTLIILLLAPVIALFLTRFVFQSYEVDGPSMQTSLFNKDRLIVLKLPRTWATITRHNYIPNRGDIVIFNRHGVTNYEDGTPKQLIKRVIGLPGERVVVKDGFVTVFNSAHPDGFSSDNTMPYGKVIKTTPGNVDLNVPEGEIFVMGDNRTNSLDSRYFGTIPASDLVGKLGLRIYPFSHTSVY
jgi:signal peptidase I